MNITGIGYNTIHGKDYALKKNGDNENYFLMLFKSPCVLNISNEKISAERDTVVIYDRKTLIDLYSFEDIFIYDWICFNLGGDGDFFTSLDIPLDTVIRYTDVNFLSELIRNLTNEFYSLSINRSKMIDSLIKAILIKISETSGIKGMSQQSSDPHYGELIGLRQKIYQNPQIKWTVELMASEVNMSKSYFQHIYREIFGISCISDVIICKIDKAKEILSTTSCTVSQTAAMCGYDSDEHFMRQFKKVAGVTPTVYRKNILKMHN
ncbi:MAG: AraC family transcriptional regulator [Oscillospiraceae bacterium]|nr:AraC family transcriptional regulator [Oscillospiraceae bacterium]